MYYTNFKLDDVVCTKLFLVFDDSDDIKVKTVYHYFNKPSDIKLLCEYAKNEGAKYFFNEIMYNNDKDFFPIYDTYDTIVALVGEFEDLPFEYDLPNNLTPETITKEQVIRAVEINNEEYYKRYGCTYIRVNQGYMPVFLHDILCNHLGLYDEVTMEKKFKMICECKEMAMMEVIKEKSHLPVPVQAIVAAAILKSLKCSPEFEAEEAEKLLKEFVEASPEELCEFFLQLPSGFTMISIPSSQEVLEMAEKMEVTEEE